jgi:hypothetical protein
MFKRVILTYLARGATFGPKARPTIMFFDLLNHFTAWPEGVMMDTTMIYVEGLSYIFHLAATVKRMWLAIRKETGTPADEIACRTSSLRSSGYWSQEEDGSDLVRTSIISA